MTEELEHPTERIYGVRCMVEPWNKPRTEMARRVADNVLIQEDNHGYCDQILVVSILMDDDRDYDSVAFFDGESGCGRPSREMMEMVRDQINHYLEHHCPD